MHPLRDNMKSRGTELTMNTVVSALLMLHHTRLFLILFLQGGGFMDMFGMMGEMMGNMVSSSVTHFQMNSKVIPLKNET